MKVLAGEFKNKACSIDARNFIIDGFLSKEKIPLTDIVAFEIEGQESKTSGGLGTAAVGGLLFGGVGAVVGAVVGRGSKTDTTVGVTLLDGRRFMAKFSGSDVDYIRAALFEVQDKTVDERKAEQAARATKAARKKEVTRKAMMWSPLVLIAAWLVLSNF
jgi:hypothetical protein